MRGFFVGVVVATVAAALLAWLALVTGIVPINADSSPSPQERWVARTAVIAGVERRMMRGRNPASGDRAVSDGIDLYKANCEICHGGAGGELSAVARGLYQRPPQFGKNGIEGIPYGYAAWVIRHGIRLTGMPAFGATLSGQQIDDVALFLERMKLLTADERFAWSRHPLRGPLAPFFAAIGGLRACIYLPKPNVAPHHFVSDAFSTPDGQFIIAQYYNRGISELSLIGADSARRRLIRLKLSKAGTADVAVARGQSGRVWSWASFDKASKPAVVTTIASRSNGSYEFRATGDPGSGACGPAKRHA